MKTVMRVVIVVAVMLLLASALRAKEMEFEDVKEGSVVISFTVDLNGDGKMEKVGLRAYNKTEEEYLGQIVVSDSRGVTIWESPKMKDRNSSDPFLFGAFNAGCSLPEIVADIDGDGKIEMLSTAPISDVSPMPFLEFRWDGRKFVFIQRKVLMESSKGSGEFAWQKPQGYTGCWIMNFKSGKGDGTFLVYIFSRYDGKEMGGQAEVRPSKSGFKVVRWVHPLKPVIS